MVNDLFNVEAAETTVVLRKLLQCHVLRLTVLGGGGRGGGASLLP